MSASIKTLQEIMLLSPSLRNRMMAAEDLLERESPPEVREAAKSFLTTIFEDREVPEGTRLQALLIIRKAEARKIAQPPAASTG